MWRIDRDSDQVLDEPDAVKEAAGAAEYGEQGSDQRNQ